MLSSILVNCPFTLEVAATRARLPWVKVEAWLVSISYCDWRCLSCLCNSNASDLSARVASLPMLEQDCKLHKSQQYKSNIRANITECTQYGTLSPSTLLRLQKERLGYLV